jgi:NADH-quinone oxidoreductase subunit F
MIQESYDLFLEKLLSQTGRGADATIPILQGIQREYRFLPAEALKRVSEKTGISLAQLVGVSTFYHQFRHKPMGKHNVRVCHGTACYVKGAPNVTESLRSHLKIADGDDTDAEQLFTVQDVFCVGCCSLAPVVQVDDITYAYQSYKNAPDTLKDYLRMQESKAVAGKKRGHSMDTVPVDAVGQIGVCLDSCCVARGCGRVEEVLKEVIAQHRMPIEVMRVTCPLMCEAMPLLEVHLPGQPILKYGRVQPEDVRGIVERHFKPGNVAKRFTSRISGWLENMVGGDVWEPPLHYPLSPREPSMVAFYGPQKHIATEHFGVYDPLDMEAYRQHEGFKGLERVLKELKPGDGVEVLKQSGLRGRGGAGFPTGLKWEKVRAAKGEKKYVVCNGDEGDPGAFMDRMLMESFPYRVIEGMMIAAYSVGANEGYVYVRAEYPFAVVRLREAVRNLTNAGLLGDNVLGTGFKFHLHIFEGAGAFVCGEETALMESIEGRRGIPRLKPPFPADSGLWGNPTLINNVETYAMVPWICRHGGEKFAALGTEKSKGTKVFALAGKVKFPGLIEVPMGITIRQIIDEIGGGIAQGKKLKAVQIGGPSGGCLPASLDNTPVDYEALVSAGAIMGSGGLVVLDEEDCMVDVARFFMKFMQSESCGQCTFCRIGTLRILEILNAICDGKGKPSDLAELERLSSLTVQGSICGLGRTAPNPVLTTLRYFRSEYEAHLAGHCPAGKCKPLIKYVVKEGCTGCTICAQHCPVNAIPLTPYRSHVIDVNKCTRCDVCRMDCPEQVIKIE